MENLKTNPAKLVLKGSPFSGIAIKEIVAQIQAKRKAEKKLPTWFESQNVIYPPLVNLAQSSSETAANYKAKLVSGKTLIDITGGFGVDDFYFSKKVEKVIHCEQNASLSKLAEHNFHVLSIRKNCKFIQGDGISYLKNLDEKADWIYADPGRRDDLGGKVFRLENCQPDILQHLSLLKAKAEKILLKTSPLLDIKQGIQQLKSVEEIHIVAIKNDVKELLWILGERNNAEIPIKTVNIEQQETQEFSGFLSEEESATANYASPLSYLYEPNAAILKSGFFKKVAKDFSLFKLAPNSHLYTSEERINFPGRRFKVLETLPFHNKTIKKTGLKKANITTRNFPLTVAQLRKKINIQDGGTDYLFFTQDSGNEKLILWCRKV